MKSAHTLCRPKGVSVPVGNASSSSVSINGQVAWFSGKFQPVPNVASGDADADGDRVSVTGVSLSLLNIRCSV
jgi:hypothetical protein